MTITSATLRSWSDRASGRSTQDSVHSHPKDAHLRESRHDDPSNGMSDLYEVLDAIDSLSTLQDSDSNEREANLMINLARAKRDVIQAQKALADATLRENEALARLLSFRAETVGKRLDDADMGLGYMRVIFKKYGWAHLPQPEGHSDLHGDPEDSETTIETADEHGA